MKRHLASLLLLLAAIPGADAAGVEQLFVVSNAVPAVADSPPSATVQGNISALTASEAKATLAITEGDVASLPADLDGKLAVAGGMMTGKLTNQSGIYGNGVGVTNVTAHALDAAASGDVSNQIATVISAAPSVFATDTDTGVVLNITTPLVVPTNIVATGFTIGGMTKTNWGTTRELLQLVGAGSSVGFEPSNPNLSALAKPALDDTADASVNYANYMMFYPADADPDMRPNIVLIASKTGASGNAVLGLAVAAGTSMPGLFGAPTFYTNTYNGNGARAVPYTMATPWMIPPGQVVTVRVSRDGGRDADNLKGTLAIQAVYMEYRRR
jgi:hypothetical protein